MSEIRIGMQLQKEIALPPEEQIRLLKKTGFDAFFAYWQYDTDVARLKKCADRHGMLFQSLHAPAGIYARHLWYKSEETERSMKIFLDCLRDCEKNRIPIMVMHSFYGFDLHEPTDFGIENYRIIADRAKKSGVKLALENLEGWEYLKALLVYFKDDADVGFCWDSGHENCYCGYDLLGEACHGEKLICTHLNDNFGISDKNGILTGLDDLHLLPFDGNIDWQRVVQRLIDWNYDGVWMFELKKNAQPQRRECAAYAKMSPEEYVKAAYERCRRVCGLYRETR